LIEFFRSAPAGSRRDKSSVSGAISHQNNERGFDLTLICDFIGG
jgi:hypothetical protein